VTLKFPTTPLKSFSRGEPAALRFFLAGMFLVYLTLGAFGYGADGDTYNLLAGGRSVWLQGVYLPSRMPGYPLPEVLTGAASLLGSPFGSLVSNALSAIAACAALACFYALLRGPFGEASAFLSAAAVAVNPHWMIAASSSMDYAYAAGFFAAGVRALHAARPRTAAICFAACIASRLTYAPLVACAFAAFWGRMGSASGTKRAVSIILLAGLSLAAYWPAWRASGGSMFQVTVGEEHVSFAALSGFASPLDYAGRFLYKNVMLWGLPVFGVVAAAAAGLVLNSGLSSGHARLSGPRARSVALWLAAAALYVELLFLRLPLEISYLLPFVFIVVTALNFTPRSRVFLGLVIAGSLVQGWIAPDLVRVRYARNSLEVAEASGASLDPGFRRGPLLVDLSKREPARLFYQEKYHPDQREQDFRPLLRLGGQSSVAW
jgi:hypothetical protein